ncbi:MAG: tetratricopeptide repeat protein [Coriobacteriia bacterium]|nr:tetratricopeptide repeat protein [Coriobacteriia bacterium]
MNTETFNNAHNAYRLKDYPAALQAFTQCLEDPDQKPEPGEIGLLYHRIGNCLVKIGDYNEAIHAFAQATADPVYDDMAAVNYNMGMAYAILHDYEDAVRYFEVAVSDNHYASPYKAYMGMGNALLRLGKSAEAGAAFRSAALDENNPSPTKALLNLGVCFMALGRPADAVTSYESALQFDMTDKVRNQLYANLGQAYVASHEYQKAVSAFEQALADKTYFLNDAASVDYQQAIAQVATGATVKEEEAEAGSVDISGLDVPASDAPEFQEEPKEAAAEETPAAEPAQQPTEAIPAVSAEAPVTEERFFTATDEELERWSRANAKEERKKRHVGRNIFLTLLLLIIIAAGAAVFAYTQGYGWPMQEQVTKQLFAAPDEATDLFAPTISQSDIDQMTKFVVQADDVAIDGVDRSMESSAVYATAKTTDGGDVQYKISFTRDLIGWKITDVSLNFASKD